MLSEIFDYNDALAYEAVVFLPDDLGLILASHFFAFHPALFLFSHQQLYETLTKRKKKVDEHNEHLYFLRVQIS